MGSDALERAIESLDHWHLGRLNASSIARISALGPEDLAEAIAELPDAADACAVRLADKPNFIPIPSYAPMGSRRLQELALVVGIRRAVDALPALLAIVETHASSDARIMAGHAIVAIGDRDAALRLANVAVEFARLQQGWFRLWVGAQLVIDPATAYIPIADRVASTAQPAPLLHAIMDAAWRAEVDDPRFGDLAVMALAANPDHFAALNVMARLGDRRAVPVLLEKLASPDFGTVSIAIEQLDTLVGADILTIAAEARASAKQRAPFDAIWKKYGAEAEPIARDRYPFLFFGAHADDADDYVYVVRFASIVQCPWPARDFEGATWAHVVRETPLSVDEAMAIHLDTPIAEIILASLIDEDPDDDWTAWSHARGTMATRAPRIDPDFDYDTAWFYRGRDVVELAAE